MVRIKARSGYVTQELWANQSMVPSFFKLTSPKWGEENSSETNKQTTTTKTQPTRRLGFSLFKSPLCLAEGGSLSVCLQHVCVLTGKHLSSTADSTCCTWDFPAAATLTSFFLLLNSLTGRKKKWLHQDSWTISERVPPYKFIKENWDYISTWAYCSIKIISGTRCGGTFL